jgi:2-methylfumaryl-CoA isomerase
VEQPGLGRMVTAASPLRWDSEYADVEPAPDFGADTEWALQEVLGLSARETGALLADGTVAVAA